MQASDRREGLHAAVSPDGRLIASIGSNGLTVAETISTERRLDFSIRIAPRDATVATWSSDSVRIAICSPKLVEVVDLEDVDRRVRLDNGSGGLGRFASAHFVGEEHLLTTWEFGRAKLWDLSTGRSTEIGDLKTTADGANVQQRPCSGGAHRQVLALLTRTGAEDHLVLHFPEQSGSSVPIKLPTVDAQSLCWSPDGRWLVVRDTPTASVGVRVYTADGHHFRSWPSTTSSEPTALGVKALTWSSNSEKIALSCCDSKVVLLSSRIFSPLATIEHANFIRQSTLASDRQTKVWREAVSASNERSYSLATQAAALPLSRTKPTTEPSELGIAEACFSCDGNFLATRDEAMLSTVWIWNIASLSAQAVVVQHNNVRRMQWHPHRPHRLLLECGEGVAYIFDVTSDESPSPVSVEVPGNPILSWLPATAEMKSAILAATKSTFRILYPEGRVETTTVAASGTATGAEAFKRSMSEDSLLDMLSGRKPLPAQTAQSYTEQVDLEADADGGLYSDGGLDDTFRAKRKNDVGEVEADPLDDSEFF